MEFQIHEEAAQEFRELPDNHREKLKEEIDSREKRENPILEQRGTGISYDNHGEPVHYFKAEDVEIDYKVFFDIIDGKVVILGFRTRDDLTYLNLREFKRRN